jgi:hypothetical protein
VTLDELIQELKKLRTGDEVGSREVDIKVFGGMRHTLAKIRSVSPGFDWTMGKIVIDTDPPVAIYRKASDKPRAAGI